MYVFLTEGSIVANVYPFRGCFFSRDTRYAIPYFTFISLGKCTPSQELTLYRLTHIPINS